MDTEHGWFQPKLTLRDDPNCDAILSAAQVAFGKTPEPGNGKSPIAKKFLKLHLITAGMTPDNGKTFRNGKGAPFALRIETVPSCGGACDQEVGITTSPAGTEIRTPDARTWSIYSAGERKYYFIGGDDDELDAYAILVAPIQLKHVCHIALAPELEEQRDPKIRLALSATDALAEASHGMSRAGGTFCGSMETPFRWENDVKERLHRALYQPWALPPSRQRESENSGGDYDRIFAQLRQWSLGGLSEHAAFLHYQETVKTTEVALVNFYKAKFHWTTQQSRAMAREAIRSAIGNSFGFYMYQPFVSPEEEQLRVALFDRAPLETIKAIPLDVTKLDAPRGHEWDGVASDSILNVAIQNPEVLRYLLESGFNPNQANAFGKTPLMYAAQFNQIDAARLLLAAGADPNAQTTTAPFQCGYDLSTVGMTPLHYAVRYAAPALIHLLIEKGAVSFSEAVKDGKAHETPLDWLVRYTSGGTGRNVLLTVGETANLKTLLRVPAPKEMDEIARKMVLNAEREFAAGHVETAYQGTKAALMADPSNDKALSDISLLALRTKRLGEAAETAITGTSKLGSNKARAAAWFNLGLVCKDRRDNFSYNGVWYCGGDSVSPFVEAWKLDPTRDHRDMVVHIMQLNGLASRPDNVCLVRGRLYRFMFDEQNGHTTERVYTLQPKGTPVDPQSIQWTINWADKPAPTIATPHIVVEYDLGEMILTVLETNLWNGEPTIGGERCQPLTGSPR